MSYDEQKSAEDAAIRRWASFGDLARTEASRVLELKSRWDSAKKVAAQHKGEYDEALAELTILLSEGPQSPDPQMKLPFDSNLEEISLPGEIQDILLDAGVGTTAELGSVIRGNHEDFASLSDIQGVTEARSDIITSAYRKWYAEKEKQIEEEAFYEDDDDDGVVTDEDPSIDTASTAGPDEVAANKHDLEGEEVSATITEDIDECPWGVGETVRGKILGENFYVTQDGKEFLLSEGEYELA